VLIAKGGRICYFAQSENGFERFEVFTAVSMKNTIFWDVAPCRDCVNRRFGDYSHLIMLVHRRRISYTLKMGATCPSEPSVNTIYTRRHIPEDDILLKNEN
jgi:hypothetical protein